VLFKIGDENRVKRVAVTTGAHDSRSRRGARRRAPGDRVVRRGHGGLADGAIVAVRDGRAARGRRAEGRRGRRRRAVSLSDLSIKRPVLTWMMALALATFGVLGFLRLGSTATPTWSSRSSA
jgi:hypothetical protein